MCLTCRLPRAPTVPTLLTTSVRPRWRRRLLPAYRLCCPKPRQNLSASLLPNPLRSLHRSPNPQRDGIAGAIPREQRLSLSGHSLILQADGNLCVYIEADNCFVGCVHNDPNIRYADAAEVVMTTGGQLTGLDPAGGVLYGVRPQPTGI